MDFNEFNFDNMKEKDNKEKIYKPTEYDNVVSIMQWLALNVGIIIASQLAPFGTVIVLLILFVLAFADVNQNLKNYARAYLILVAASLLILLIFNYGLLIKILKILFS